MTEYVLWGEVQRQLTDHLAETGQTYSFYDAVRELVDKGQVRREKDTVSPLPATWSIADPEEFEAAFYYWPIELEQFQLGSVGSMGLRENGQQVTMMDTSPVRIAWDQTMGLHTHDAFEVGFLLRGSGQFCLGQGRNISLRPGSLYIAAPHGAHDVTVERGGQLVCIPLAEQTVEDTLYKLLRYETVLTDFLRRGLKSDRGCMVFELPPSPQVRGLLDALWREFPARRPYAEASRADIVELLFIELLRYQSSAEYVARWGAASRRTGIPVVAVLQYIESHYKTVSLGVTAAHFHYNVQYLSRLIKTETGRNFTDIVRELRLREAKRLLRTTNLSMSEVAQEAGYPSEEHFFHIFRRVESTTPGAYRAASRV